MAKKFTLRDIGALMHATAERTGQSHRTLGKGLQLNLYRSTALDGVRWMLVLSREDCAPSPQEVAIVRRDFAVPSRAESVATNRVVSLTWLEPSTVQIEQRSLVEVR